MVRVFDQLFLLGVLVQVGVVVGLEKRETGNGKWSIEPQH